MSTLGRSTRRVEADGRVSARCTRHQPTLQNLWSGFDCSRAPLAPLSTRRVAKLFYMSGRALACRVVYLAKRAHSDRGRSDTFCFRSPMSKSRRQFLAQAPLALLGAAVASYAQDQKPTELPPGAPPAFGTAPAVGPEVSPATFAEAEKLVQVEFSSEELAQAAGNWRSAMAPLYERRVGPHKVALEPTLAPWSRSGPGTARATTTPTAQRTCPQQNRSRPVT